MPQNFTTFELKTLRVLQVSSDPRYYQIFVLTCLLIYGWFGLNFDIDPLQATAMVTTAMATQYIGTRLVRLPAFDPRSAWISALSLCLLVRANSLAWATLAAVLSIGSKFALRRQGKHIFNPTNFGIGLLIVLTDGIWVSPGQWGSVAFFAFFVVCLGGLVVYRSARSDVTYAFLAFYLAVLFGRALWLGDPLTIPLHQLQSGAFLIFTFFMISDPKTTPDSRAGRILFAFLVAIGAGFVHFKMFQPNGLIKSLLFMSLLTPVIDKLLPGPKYEWRLNQKQILVT